MKKGKFNSFYKHTATFMAFFMLVGQFALFHFHIHVDEENHQKASERITVKVEKQRCEGELLSILESKDCNVCDLYLSKKLDRVETFIFLFETSEQEQTFKIFSDLADLHKFYYQLRAPPITHA